MSRYPVEGKSEEAALTVYIEAIYHTEIGIQDIYTNNNPKQNQKTFGSQDLNVHKILIKS